MLCLVKVHMIFSEAAHNTQNTHTFKTHEAHLVINDIPTTVGIRQEAPGAKQLPLLRRQEQAFQRIVVRIPGVSRHKRRRRREGGEAGWRDETKGSPGQGKRRRDTKRVAEARPHIVPTAPNLTSFRLPVRICVTLGNRYVLVCNEACRAASKN